MGALSKHRVLIAGFLSPMMAIGLSVLADKALLNIGPQLQKEWLFRLVVSTALMTLPFLITLLFVRKDRHDASGLRMSGKIGLAMAFLSLLLIGKPVKDGFLRVKQENNKRMRGVAAPLFATRDLAGNPQRLADYKGKVVLVNIWATWCAPCRAEMPALEHLYKERKGRGLVVLGMSDESIGTQERFLKSVPVTYPLLTLNGDVPNFYRDIARYPEMFLVDRAGRLQPTPDPGQPFEQLEARVDALLNEDPSR